MYCIQRAEHLLCDDGYNKSYEINKKQKFFFLKPFSKISKDYSLITLFTIYYFIHKKFKLTPGTLSLTYNNNSNL
jgi:hypothetical protein